MVMLTEVTPRSLLSGRALQALGVLNYGNPRTGLFFLAAGSRSSVRSTRFRRTFRGSYNQEGSDPAYALHGSEELFEVPTVSESA
jgi:hypothetical protein